jgi:hypothetical protein
MRRAIITLTTDFGLSDHFVGAMKGVILGIAPNAQIVDITHAIRPFQITEGAFAIAEACRFCGSTGVEGIARITQYFSRISGWNKGKLAELRDRYRNGTFQQ